MLKSTVLVLACSGAGVGDMALIAVLGALWARQASTRAASTSRASAPTTRGATDGGDSPEEFIVHFGHPDVDYVNDVERPVPTMRVRLLEYKRARVRVVYTAGFEPERPYSWRYIGVQDLVTDAFIPLAEAQRRLRRLR